MDDIESRDLPMELEKTAIMDAKATVVETYFNNFVSMGLMQALGGNGGVPLTQCPAL
jgi:hypothetical protein